MTESIAGDIITETRDGDGGQTLTLRRTPVAKVLSLTIDGLEIPLGYGATGAGCCLTGNNTLVLWGYVFTRRPGNVVIRYRVTQAPDAAPPGYSEKIRDWAIRTARERPAGTVDGVAIESERKLARVTGALRRLIECYDLDHQYPAATDWNEARAALKEMDDV